MRMMKVLSLPKYSSVSGKEANPARKKSFADTAAGKTCCKSYSVKHRGQLAHDTECHHDQQEHGTQFHTHGVGRCEGDCGLVLFGFAQWDNPPGWPTEQRVKRSGLAVWPAGVGLGQVLLPVT